MVDVWSAVEVEDATLFVVGIAVVRADVVAIEDEGAVEVEDVVGVGLAFDVAMGVGVGNVVELGIDALDALPVHHDIAFRPLHVLPLPFTS